MKKALLALAVSVAAAFAQAGPGGPGGAGPGQPQGVGLDMSKVTVVEGKVTSVAVGYGAQYPSITLAQKQVRVAPVWFLLESDFEIVVGQTLKVTAAPSLRTGDAYLYAIRVVNSDSGASLAMRDEAGVPLWTGPRGAAGAGEPQGTGGGCVDPGSIATLKGVVADVTMGAGIQMPRLVLNAAGEQRTIKLGPERILLGKDFAIEKGDELTVKMALAACSGEYIALALTNAAGKSIVLRNDDGTPAW